MQKLEIERKFLLAAMPCLEKTEGTVLRQGYISTDPVIRIRSEDDKRYYLTIKGKSTEGKNTEGKNTEGKNTEGKSKLKHISHEEYELEITRRQFEKLWLKVEGFTIEKTRYRIPLGLGLIAELDEYLGRLKGFYTVEVEFQTVEDANNFIPPNWFGKDITDDLSYRNSSLSISIEKLSTLTHEL